MKTYILKRPVYNSVDFPMGTIVKHITEHCRCFEVVEGKQKGEKGDIADGLFEYDFVCDDTQENRKLIKQFQDKEDELEYQRQENYKFLDNIPSSKKP